jgi:hypothetical protein
MIEEIAADAGPIGDNFDADLAEMIGGPDPRAHQDGRGAVGAGTEDDLARAPAIAVRCQHARRGAILDDDPIDEDRGHDREVRPPSPLREVCERRVHACVALNVLRPRPDGGLLVSSAVEVLDERVAE